MPSHELLTELPSRLTILEVYSILPVVIQASSAGAGIEKAKLDFLGRHKVPLCLPKREEFKKANPFSPATPIQCHPNHNPHEITKMAGLPPTLIDILTYVAI